MACLRCPTCLTSWPYDERFEKCPSRNCEDEETHPINNVKPDLTMEDALSKQKDEKFEKFYAEWDESHDPDRLKTDGLRGYAACLDTS